jgi:hypothetical protein
VVTRPVELARWIAEERRIGNTIRFIYVLMDDGKLYRRRADIGYTAFMQLKGDWDKHKVEACLKLYSRVKLEEIPIKEYC